MEDAKTIHTRFEVEINQAIELPYDGLFYEASKFNDNIELTLIHNKIILQGRKEGSTLVAIQPRPPATDSGQLFNVKVVTRSFEARKKFIEECVREAEGLTGPTEMGNTGVLLVKGALLNPQADAIFLERIKAHSPDVIYSPDHDSPRRATLEEKIANLESKCKQFELNLKQLVPTGAIAAYWGEKAPEGWLLCDGSPIPIGNEYDALIILVGTNTPDLRGEFLRGWDNGRGIDSNREIGSWQDYMIKNHAHSVREQSSSNDSANHSAKQGVTRSNPSNDSTGEVLLGTLHVQKQHVGDETRPRNVAVNFIIKY